MIRADGRRIWLRIVGTVEFADGKPSRYVGAMQDVTERVSERLALERAHERATLATESGGIGIADWDVVTGETNWDAQLYRLFGLEPHSEPATIGAVPAHVASG